MITGTLVINADGASRGNPGPAAIGATIKDENGRLLASVSQRIGRTTNNQAEYRALIAALEKAISLEARRVDIRLDSELVVRQVEGRYKVKKATLRPLYLRVGELLGRLEGFTLTHVPREQNAEADRLANAALKRS
ncbi:MAG TPA: ribonuclease HI family protein [Dehalococcoidales bacterium]|nr:ribonuclease HI family protein [Dehalococcoidales bacterium]